MNKLLCNAILLFLGGTLLISNAQKPKFTYEYMITSNSNDINDMLVMYDVKQDFIKTYDELVLSLNEEYHRDTIINNLDKFISKAAPSVPQSLMYKAIRQKDIKVNRKRAEISTRLNVGDIVSEYLNEKIVITIGEGKGGTIEGYLKSNICDSEKTNYRIFIFDLLFGE